MKTVVVEVSGEPAPKGSTAMGVTKTGRTYIRPASPKTKAWQKLVEAACCDLTPLQPPYEVNIVFRFTSPQKPSRKYPSRNDIDKLARTVCDGLVNGEIIEDDRHIIRLSAQKEYGTEGAVITVRSLSD